LDCGGKAKRRHRFFMTDAQKFPTIVAHSKAPSPLRSGGAVQNAVPVRSQH
jgi:hypothetical protein